MTVDDFKPENLAQALRGSVSSESATTVTDEIQSLYAGRSVVLDYIPDTAQTITVKAAPSTVWAESTAYELGDRIVESNKVFEVTTAGTSKASPKPTFTDTHYKVTNSGITALPAADALFAGGLRLKISYTKNPQYLVQALTDAGTEYLLVFDGLNEVDSGNSVIVKIHRTKFSPTSGLDLIGDDFGEIKMEFSALKDASIVAAGLSQYMQIAMV